ncbi:hypothetical protein XHC_4316 [Xanthomonas hortorum pv. carotae str. M081]|nr:hypothetical protein XHC_4316 [Xanthomonas hortorum pv. carotae str. M081]
MPHVHMDDIGPDRWRSQNEMARTLAGTASAYMMRCNIAANAGSTRARSRCLDKFVRRRQQRSMSDTGRQHAWNYENLTFFHRTRAHGCRAPCRQRIQTARCADRSGEHRAHVAIHRPRRPVPVHRVGATGGAMRQ